MALLTLATFLRSQIDPPALSAAFGWGQDCSVLCCTFRIEGFIRYADLFRFVDDTYIRKEIGEIT